MNDPQQPNNRGQQRPSGWDENPTQEIRLDQAGQQRPQGQPQQGRPYQEQLQYRYGPNGHDPQQSGPQQGPNRGQQQFGGQPQYQGPPPQYQQGPQYQQTPQYQGQQFQGQQYQPQQQGPHGGFQPHPHRQQHEPQRNEPRRKNSDRGIIIALVIAIIAVLLAVLAFGWSQGWFGSSSDDDAAQSSSQQTSQSGEASSSASSSSSAPSSTSESASRPKNPSLPSGAMPVNEAAQNNQPAGDFNNVYRGTQITSEAFALATRDAFVDNYIATKNTNAALTVYSPVTGQTYSMSCQDNKQYVTCTGGNDAVVYIS